MRFSKLFNPVLALVCTVSVLGAAERNGEYLIYGPGSISLQKDKVSVKGSGDPHTAAFVMEELAEPSDVVAIRALAKHTGGRHRTIFLALGTTQPENAFVIGGPWTGINRNGVAQYTDPAEKPIDQWLPPTKSALPDVKNSFYITLMVDATQKKITAVVQGNTPVERELKLPMTTIDLAGFAVRGETQASFDKVEIATGRDAASALLQKAISEPGQEMASNSKGETSPASVEKIAEAKSVNATGWVDNVYNRPSNSLSLNNTPDGQVLESAVHSRADMFLKTPIRFRGGKTMKIELTARAVGQIEQLAVLMNDKKFPSINLPIYRDWHTYVIQVKTNGAYRFNIRLDGVGEFQVKDIQITESDSFDIPQINASYRDELLINGDFSLGDAGWSLIYPQEMSVPALGHRPELEEVMVSNQQTGEVELQLEEGHRSLIDAGDQLTFFRGRDYTLRVEGSAADGDMTLFLIRPGMSVIDNEKWGLKFENGVATINFSMDPPNDGWFEGSEQLFALRLRHDGKEPAIIRKVSIQEKNPHDSVSQTQSPRAALSLIVAGKERPYALYGNPVGVRVLTDGFKIGESFEVTISDENGDVVRRMPAIAENLDGKGIGSELVVTDLQPGWYQFSVSAPKGAVETITQDFAIILPTVPEIQRNGFLNTHLNSLTKDWHLDLLAQLGVNGVRVWELQWDSIQPKKDDDVSIPENLLDAYQKAGLQPMAVLGGTPDWASSAPAQARSSWRGAQKYAPQDMADWDNYVRQAVRDAGDRVNFYEIWNEPNGHWLKAPKGQNTKDIYAELVRRAYPIIKQENPNAVVVIGACAGHPSFAIDSIKKGNLKGYYDAISYHAYGASESAGQGAPAFAITQGYLENKLRELDQPDLPIIDSESGIKNIEPGPEGAFDSMVLAKGLVSRQAAGFDRYYMYNTGPRQYPGQTNFNMLFSFNDRPLVTVPMIAAWDRFLGNAAFIESLGNEDAGQHVYRFRRNDGYDVIAGWISSPQASSRIDQTVLARPQAADAFGRPLADATQGETLLLSEDLRYFFPTELGVKIYPDGRLALR